MKSRDKKIEVYANWDFEDSPVQIGELTTQLIRGKEVFSFEYQKAWIDQHQHLLLDPDLLLYSGKQYLRDEKQNFGIFSDSAPDRWGRMLIQRREAIAARTEGRPQRTLFESDYLLGVFDEQRLGAIRLKTAPDGPFQNADSALSIPPLKSLNHLEHAAWELESEELNDVSEQQKWINTLLAPGSSIGGARPKAGVIDPFNHLWIAKFPSRNDTWDVAKWEILANTLAKKVGISVAESRMIKLQKKYHTFLSKRFDRTTDGKRIHFASAMTMLGYSDGTDASEGASYLEIAEFLTQHGASPKQDLEELWTRIVFNIYISNTDDHLRNHGFLLTPIGWRLSPAYDINPIPNSYGLKLNINEFDNSLDPNLALEVASYFKINTNRAREIEQRIKSNVMNWETEARQLDIARSDIDILRGAFRV